MSCKSDLESCKTNLEDTLKRFRAKSNELIGQLQHKITEIEGHHYSCNVAKTVGTSVSGVGTVMTIGTILAAPFTGGLSLFLTAGGLSMTAVGAVTNVTTDFIDIAKSMDFMEKIKSLANEYKDLATEVQIKIEKVLGVVNELKASGIDEDEAFIIAFGGLAAKIYLVGKDIWNPVDLARGLMEAAFYFKAINSFGVDMSFKYVNTATQMGKTGASIGGSVTKNVVKGVGVVAGVGLTVVDVALIIRDWNTKHPTIKVIKDLVNDIDNAIKKANNILYIMNPKLKY